jgi:Zn-finger nucleic acid-binding protein
MAADPASPVSMQTSSSMATRELKCPRSATPLSRLRVGGVDTDVCEDCGGLWLDRFELARFDDPDNAFGDALTAHLTQFPAAVLAHSVRLRCPRHPATVMLRRAYSREVPIEIDECPECGGVWLDTYELAQIRARRSGSTG